MRWLDRLGRFTKFSERIKKPANAFIAIVTVASTLYGAVSLTIRYRLYSWEGIQENFLDLDNSIKLQKILKKTATATNADRAFFMYYERLENGEDVAVFKRNYQWQVSGQTTILDARYPLQPGADTARRKAAEANRCHEVVVSELPLDDELAIALKDSGVRAQITCPFKGIPVDGRNRVGVVGVEFGLQTYDRTEVEKILWEAGADVLKSFL